MGAMAILSIVWSLLKRVWKPLSMIAGGFMAGKQTVEKADAKASADAAVRMEKAAAAAPSDKEGTIASLNKGEF